MQWTGSSRTAAQKEKSSQSGATTTDETPNAIPFVPKPAQKEYRYRGHAGLTVFAEFLMTMMYIRHSADFPTLALRWFGKCTEVSRKTTQYIVYTWIAFLYSIVQVTMRTYITHACIHTCMHPHAPTGGTPVDIT